MMAGGIGKHDDSVSRTPSCICAVASGSGDSGRGREAMEER